MIHVGPSGQPPPFRPLAGFAVGQPAPYTIAPSKMHLRELAAEISDMDEATLTEFTRLLQEALNTSRTGVTLRLDNAGPNKIRVIKEVRDGTSLSLKDAKELVDRAPSLVMVGDRVTVYGLAAALENAGASVTVH